MSQEELWGEVFLLLLEFSTLEKVLLLFVGTVLSQRLLVAQAFHLACILKWDHA